MYEAARRFKFLSWLMIAGLCFSNPAGEAAQYRTTETGFYRDVFDQNIYYEGLSYFHLDRAFRKLFNKKARSKNINVYDEVPDSSFFVNRHERKKLGIDELKAGPGGSAPDFSKPVTVLSGKFEGVHPGFFIQDAKGDKYFFKFDPQDNFELVTGAEAVASRFFHAIGYNVPLYSIGYFTGDQMNVSDNATTYDDTGFKKKLTSERLQEYLIFLPQDDQGRFRVSASKLLEGEDIGYMNFTGLRWKSEADKTDHKDRREIRALRVFASWLNIYHMRESNSVEMLQDHNGEKIIKHYLTSFSDALGASTDGPKPPMYTHEHLFDYGDQAKAFFSLGFWKKPWQKRWEESGMQVNAAPAVGYFDNRYFDPEKFKTQLPYYAFKDLTLADAFWAAKIIMNFSDEEIRSLVETGQYMNPADVETISKTLIERRDIIGKYWYGKVSPLDRCDIQASELTFTDLEVDAGFEKAENKSYIVDRYDASGKKPKKISSTTVTDTRIPLTDVSKPVDIMIRSVKGSGRPNPFVIIKIRDGRIAGIYHQD